jgi:hypothetical protein
MTIATTALGYSNKRGQMVVRKTGLAGNDHNQSIYELRCAACNVHYGANGSDIHLRKCPCCQGGAKGLAY